MDIKTWLTDLVDPRPIPRVTSYASGTGLVGIAFGIYIAGLCSPGLPAALWFAAGACAAVGVALAVSGYSFLKRRCQIVERTAAEHAAEPR